MECESTSEDLGRVPDVQPAVWESAEPSRASSPQPFNSLRQPSTQSGSASSPAHYDHRWGRPYDDPVTTQIISGHVARNLFDLFRERCHPFLPVVDTVATFDSLQRHPFLFSTVCAIAARFYRRFAQKIQTVPPELDSTASHRLANLAEMHLATTLMGKRHSLGDVQSCLLLAAWGLGVNGHGSDAWVLSGHACRIAQRLAVPLSASRTPSSISRTQSLMVKWRAW